MVPGIKIPGIKRGLGLEDDNEVSGIIPFDPSCIVMTTSSGSVCGFSCGFWLSLTVFGMDTGFALPMLFLPTIDYGRPACENVDLISDC